MTQFYVNSNLCNYSYIIFSAFMINVIKIEL